MNASEAQNAGFVGRNALRWAAAKPLALWRPSTPRDTNAARGHLWRYLTTGGAGGGGGGGTAGGGGGTLGPASFSVHWAM